MSPLLAVVLLALVNVIKGSPLPINDFKVQSLDSGGPLYERGWDFIPVDLNKGAGGRFIYVGYKRGLENPITTVTFRGYGDALGGPEPGYEWSPEDLNKGAGGLYIYMMWKREAGKIPITGLLFIVTDQTSPQPIPGWISIGLDLNKGAGGPFIWPYYSHTEEPQWVVDMTT